MKPLRDWSANRGIFQKWRIRVKMTARRERKKIWRGLEEIYRVSVTAG